MSKKISEEIEETSKETARSLDKFLIKTSAWVNSYYAKYDNWIGRMKKHFQIPDKYNYLKKVRRDGKEQKVLFWLTFFFGYLGVNFFYLKMYHQGWTRLIISWVGGTIIVITWIVYGTSPGMADVDFGYNILAPTLFGGALVCLSVALSFVDCIFILNGKFKDEKNVRVKDWDGNYRQYVIDLANGVI